MAAFEDFVTPCWTIPTLAPLDMPVLIVHGVNDETVSIELSRSYVDATRAAGGEAELVEIQGEAGHRAHLDPRGESWAAVVKRLEPVAHDHAATRAAASQSP